MEAATADAVAGLRRFNYSWSEIATRLGVSRQAAQMRWGNRTDRGRLDDRLLDAGLGVSVPLLVAVFVDHYPGTRPPNRPVPAAASSTRPAGSTAPPASPCGRCCTGAGTRTPRP